VLKIYISSTYSDLADYRRAARDAILALQQFPVGMEDYRASDERPLDRCLQDVRASDAYVGIFAWKYGFRPGNAEKSITQLEYEQAVASKIPCYIFLLQDDAPWPRNLIPYEDQPRIQALRDTLRSERLVSFFRDTESLGRVVTQSLARVVGNAVGIDVKRPPVPDILPYLCDRSDQEFVLADSLKQSTAGLNRLNVYIIHGDETEAHDKFLERLQKVTLPLLLPAETRQTGIQVFRLEWPANFDTATDMSRRLEMNLSKEVLDFALGNKESINARLARFSGPVATHSHVITENWQQKGALLLDAFLGFWEEWPELSVGERLLVFLFVKYQVRSLGPYRDRQLRQANASIRETLTNYDFGRFDRLGVSVLPELRGPTLSETQDWARSEETGRFCDPQALVSAIAEYYTEWEMREKPKSKPIRIPTELLAPKLRELMSQVNLQGTI
jgi:hypothetical protein